MTGNAAFQEFYLREIGVQTPLDMHVSGEPSVEPVVDAAVDTPPSMEKASTQERSMPAVVASAATHELQADVLQSETAQVAVQAVVQDSALQEIAMQAADCTACQLAEGRSHVVFGVGNPQADIVFIGEAPGQEEDLKGEPFVGRAGKLLDRMLAAQGMDRSQVYIMNTVKCRPPNNRDPKPEEVQACGKWFDAQLKALSPKLICLLGRVAAQTVLESDASLSAMRGRWHDYHGIPVRVLYHPAYLLRSPQQKRHAWHDLCELQKRYQLLS